MADNHIKFPTPENTDDSVTPIAPEINPPRADEVFPDLGNEKLVEAMVAINGNENKETQATLIENVLKAKFFAPVEVIDAEGNVLKGSGKIAIPKDAKFNFKLIQNSNGQQYFAVFTDIRQFMMWSKSAKVNTIVVVFPQIAQLAQQKSDVISGVVINPMGHNIIFTQESISSLLGAMKLVADKEKERREAAAAAAAEQQERQVQLFFGKPQNIPDAVYGAFRKKLAKISEVREAYFCMMKRDEQEYYLFTLDIDADSERSRQIGDSFCESAKLFLTKFPIMAAPTDSPFGEGAKKVDSPFYTKED